jgi:glycosyltransferase involved in cell wall biosynthesis
MIRICHLLQGLDVGRPESAGGAEQFALELIMSLDPDLFRISVCVLWQSGGETEARWVSRLKEKNIPVEFLETRTAGQDGLWSGLRRFLAVFPGLYSYLKSHPADILHSHCASPDLASALIKPILPIRFLMRTAQNEKEWPDFPWLRRIAIGWVFPFLFTREIGVSKTVVAALNKRPGSRLTRKKADLIYNGIDLSRFNLSDFDPLRKRKELSLPVKQPLIAIIGRLVEQKGHAYFFQAAQKIIHEIPGVHFLVIGSGPLWPLLQLQVKELGIEQQVRFLGARSDVGEWLLTVDLLVSSSLWEGLSLVLLEGMAAGCPVVATDVSGSREILGNNEFGLLVPPADPQALAEAMLWQLKEPRREGLYQQAARQQAASFDIKKMAGLYERLYQSLLKN